MEKREEKEETFLSCLLRLSNFLCRIALEKVALLFLKGRIVAFFFNQREKIFVSRTVSFDEESKVRFYAVHRNANVWKRNYAHLEAMLNS